MRVGTYRCDSCGLAINDPHSIRMREFSYTGVHTGNCFRKVPFVYAEKIHLCDTCFHSLRDIAEMAVQKRE